MNVVAFRADGGAHIGMGHVMRCLSLAKEFRRNGYEVYFISKFREGISRIREESFPVIQLDCNQIEEAHGFKYGNHVDINAEAEELIAIIRKYDIDSLFIDTYNVTDQYFSKIKPYVKKLGYIDDLNKFVYPVDILINGNVTAQYMHYTKYSDDEILLLGPQYNLIRDEFRSLPPRKIKEKVEEIMITTGGSDPHNMSLELLNIVLSEKTLRDLRTHVIVGDGFTNKEELRRISKNNENVILHENVNLISSIMLASDVAISAGGSTLYELCACGTPTLAFIMADNQESIVRKMAELGYVVNLGWFDELESQRLVSLLKYVMSDHQYRLEVSNRQQKLVDARGTERIVKVLSSIKP